MFNFNQLHFKTRVGGGIYATFSFPNGYGCSVIRGPGSYGNAQGLYEMAILDANDNICYTTGITSDVLGYLTEDDVSYYMKEISKLSTEDAPTP
jgi:hypothetical protein